VTSVVCAVPVLCTPLFLLHELLMIQPYAPNVKAEKKPSEVELEYAADECYACLIRTPLRNQSPRYAMLVNIA